MNLVTRRTFGSLSTAAAVAVATPLRAQQMKLRWAHVYEIGEPYHVEAMWAASEIARRTNGKFQIDVFPASQLGNESQINEGLSLGTVDMIYTGIAFAGSIHRPIAISNAPMCCGTMRTGSSIATRGCSDRSAPVPQRTRRPQWLGNLSPIMAVTLSTKPPANSH